MKLTDTFLRNLKTTGKVQKHSDGGGLYLQVSPSGGKLWRMAYRFDDKQKTLSFGAYPAVSLKDARVRREAAKEQLADGIDPGAAKKEARKIAAAKEREEAATFEAVAREWYSKKTIALSLGHQKKVLSRLENQLFPYIGAIPISKLEPADILRAVRHAEERGLIETAHRLAQLAGQVCRYARLVGYAKFDVAARLVEALPPYQRGHYAAITDPIEIGHLLRAIDNYPGDISMIYALRILPYVFVRSGELRGAEWQEINLNAAEWIIPARRQNGTGMKMNRPHVVPLPPQVVRLLEELGRFTRGGRYLFPSAFSASRCISDVGLLNALRRMGYAKDRMTIHGFRSMASTLLNEQGYRPDVIEAQLAHGDKDLIRSAYNRAEYLTERRQMMAEWANYLDELRAQTT
ncbi:MAG: integrase arm-type DNA-binding domain-containing protein [Desulfovibrionaceae bacterium]|nr:integrase arm-type DNA-binding domain-containing protein [Desulfovibrionaceae bacterium]